MARVAVAWTEGVVLRDRPVTCSCICRHVLAQLLFDDPFDVRVGQAQLSVGYTASLGLGKVLGVLFEILVRGDKAGKRMRIEAKQIIVVIQFVPCHVRRIVRTRIAEFQFWYLRQVE